MFLIPCLSMLVFQHIHSVLTACSTRNFSLSSPTYFGLSYFDHLKIQVQLMVPFLASFFADFAMVQTLLFEWSLLRLLGPPPFFGSYYCFFFLITAKGIIFFRNKLTTSKIKSTFSCTFNTSLIKKFTPPYLGYKLMIVGVNGCRQCQIFILSYFFKE